MLRMHEVMFSRYENGLNNYYTVRFENGRIKIKQCTSFMISVRKLQYLNDIINLD
jgi:hypothetical protein